MAKQNNSKKPHEGQKKNTESDSKEVIPLEIIEEVNAINPNLLKNLSAEKKKELASTVFMMQMRSHSGPLPSPETFEGYERVLQGSAERIITMAEKQQDHRMTMESTHLNKEHGQSRTGQWLGFVLALFAMALGGYLTLNGHDTVGGILLGSTLVSLVTVFVLGKTMQKN